MLLVLFPFLVPLSHDFVYLAVFLNYFYCLAVACSNQHLDRVTCLVEQPPSTLTLVDGMFQWQLILLLFNLLLVLFPFLVPLSHTPLITTGLFHQRIPLVGPSKVQMMDPLMGYPCHLYQILLKYYNYFFIPNHLI